MTRDILQSRRDSYQKMLWTSEYSNFQVKNYNSHESVSMNSFLWLPLWDDVYMCMCVCIEMLLVCLRLCLNVGSLIPLVAGWFFTSQPWLVRSRTDKQWKWRRWRALMKLPDPLLGFCCCVFIILKDKMQVFTTCLFLSSPYSAMWEIPSGHCYSGDAMRLQPISTLIFLMTPAPHSIRIGMKDPKKDKQNDPAHTSQPIEPWERTKLLCEATILKWLIMQLLVNRIGYKLNFSTTWAAKTALPFAVFFWKQQTWCQCFVLDANWHQKYGAAFERRIQRMSLATSKILWWMLKL